MACDCKNTGIKKEGCACCVPSGVTNLTTCSPYDPCDGEYYDICCIKPPVIPCLNLDPTDNFCEALANILAELTDRCNCECACYRITNTSGSTWTRNYFKCNDDGSNTLVPAVVDNNESKVITGCINLVPSTIPPGILIEDATGDESCNNNNICVCHIYEIINLTNDPWVRSYTGCSAQANEELTVTVYSNQRKVVCGCDDLIPVLPLPNGITIKQLSEDPCDDTTSVCICNIYTVTNNTNTTWIRNYSGCKDGENYPAQLILDAGVTVEICGCNDFVPVIPVPGIVIVDSDVICDSPLCEFEVEISFPTTTTTSTTIGPCEITGTIELIKDTTTTTSSTSTSTTSTTSTTSSTTSTTSTSSTSTTSTSSTTSTTSTTSTSSTTTSTTLAPVNCICYLIGNATGDTSSYTYIDCDTQEVIPGELPLGNIYKCAAEGSLNVAPGIGYEPLGPCDELSLCATTTSTSTTTTTTACPTAGIEWTVTGVTGAELFITRDVSGLIVDQISDGATHTGTVSNTLSTNSYIIQAVWTSGVTNSVKMRICNLTTLTEYSFDSGSGSGTSFTQNITLNPCDQYSVYVTSGPITPPICPI